MNAQDVMSDHIIPHTHLTSSNNSFYLIQHKPAWFIDITECTFTHCTKQRT